MLIRTQKSSSMKPADPSPTSRTYPPNFSLDITMEYVHIGALLLGIGAWFTYWKRKRAFNRTNEYGVERFPSYWRKVVSLARTR